MFWLTFTVFLAACATAAATGAMFGPGPWYRNLKKPSWNPPDWLFPVAWSVLYLAMSYAAALVATSGAATAGLALGFWAVQIALNTLWSPVFFGLHRMRSALYIVALLWVAVLITLILFFTISPLAGLLFVPYLVWVTVATALNNAVLRLNPDFGG